MNNLAMDHVEMDHVAADHVATDHVATGASPVPPKRSKAEPATAPKPLSFRRGKVLRRNLLSSPMKRPRVRQGINKVIPHPHSHSQPKSDQIHSTNATNPTPHSTHYLS